jgi:hypothetical protein
MRFAQEKYRKTPAILQICSGLMFASLVQSLRIGGHGRMTRKPLFAVIAMISMVRKSQNINFIRANGEELRMKNEE